MDKRGFTLLEVLIVIGLFAIVAGLIVSVGLHTHSGFTTKDDADLAIATLQKARSQSMHGVCINEGCIGPIAHGVHVTPHALVLFEGTIYNPIDSANENIPALSNATTFGGNDIIFAPTTGSISAANTLTISDTNFSTTTITIGMEGQLSWGN